jgi:CheY-like chemotaxis protein
MTLKGKILAVDDEEGITEYLETLFTDAGFEVQTASGGWQAWDKICREPFDFVMTDVRMERGDGIELVEKVRDMPAPKPLIAIMSAYTDVLISDLYDRGAVAFISKPPTSSELINTVIKALKDDATKWLDTNEHLNAAELNIGLESIGDALKLGVLAFGAGGMFLHISNAPSLEGRYINFNIEFENGAIKHLQGYGLVKWIRTAGSPLFYAGIGVEFSKLSLESKAFILNQIKTVCPKAFIPIGMIPASAKK